jgi:Ca2+-binding RTX toxin-like protein
MTLRGAPGAVGDLMRDWQAINLIWPRLGSLHDALRGRAGGVVPVALPEAVTQSTQSQSINVWDTYTVAAGETVDFTSNVGFSLNASPSFLTIAGTVTLNWQGDSFAAVGIGHYVVSGGGGGLVLIEDSGVLQVTATGLAGAWGYRARGEDSIVNHGLFEVSGNGDAYGIETSGVVSPPFPKGIVFQNTGTLQVTAGGYASGFYIWNAGNDAFYGNENVINSGTVSVDGGQGAVGLELFFRANVVNSGTIDVSGGDVAVGIGPQILSLDNSGTIRARVTSPEFASVGVLVGTIAFDPAGRLQHYELSNTGKIIGDYAILVDDRIWGDLMPSRETIFNSGTMRGAVSLSFGDDSITNTGRIIGTIDLGEGDDSYIGSKSMSAAVVFAGFGADRMIGGKKADVFFGDDGADAVIGGKGDDIVGGGRGSDALDGGAGFDTLWFVDSTAAIKVNFAAGTAVSAAGNDVFRNFEGAIGGLFADTLVGSADAQVLEGNAGNDALSGGGGDDVLIGDTGTDTLDGGGGKDAFVFSLGDGHDVVTDFDAGWNGETLFIYGYTNFQTIEQHGADTLVVLSAADSILLKGVNASDLRLDNFSFNATPLDPAPVEHLQTQIISSRLQIADGEVFSIVNPAPVANLLNFVAENTGILMVTPAGYNFGNVVNGGVVHVEADAASGMVTGISSADVEIPLVYNRGTGVIEVVASGGADARAIAIRGGGFWPTVWNEGRIEASSDGGNATGIDSEWAVNSGVVTVTAALNAVGVTVSWRLWNDGEIHVSGAGGSVGVDVVATIDSFVNTGTITVTDDTADLDSIGLEYHGSYFSQPIYNSGTIEADYAILWYNHTSPPNTDPQTIYNTGTLDGRVEMGRGPDKLYNWGLITGQIDLGFGDDLYDGRTGTQSGGVFGGNGNDTLLGGLGSDTLDGGNGNNILSGGAGNDILIAGTGKDTFRFEAGSGADEVQGYEAGKDSIAVVGYSNYLSLVQDGADTLIRFSASDTLRLENVSAASLGAVDFIFSAAPIPDAPDPPAPPRPPETPPIATLPTPPYMLVGNDNGNTLTGDDREDFIQGEGGGDTLSGLGGDDRIAGGAGNDKVFGGAGNDTIDGGDGDDILDGGLGVNELIGGAGADVFVYHPGAFDIFWGFNPHEGDVIRIMFENIQEGTQAYHAQNSWDFLEVDVSTWPESAFLVDFNGGSAFDGTPFYILRAIEVWGTEGDDIINAVEMLHHYVGLGGNDQLYGYAYDDYLDGGAGDDLLDGSGGIDTAIYSSATGRVTVDLALNGTAQAVGGGQGTDTLISIENLVGSAFADRLLGDANPNTLNGGAGNDRLDGRDGIDAASYEDAEGGVTVDLGIATVQPVGGGQGADTLISIENLLGSAFADALAGNSITNVLFGGAGDDALHGGGGDDTLEGGAGDDAYYGGAGVDEVILTVVSTGFAGVGVTVDLSITTAQDIGGGLGTDTFVGVETLVGSNYGDTLSGNASANTLQGGSGDDILSGGAGDDTLDGGNNIDTVSYANATGGVTVNLGLAGAQAVGGGQGLDTLVSVERVIGSSFDDVLTGSRVYGGDGDDTLYNARYSDTFDGGNGDDFLIFVAGFNASDTIIGGAGFDTLVIDSGFVSTVFFNETTMTGVEKIVLRAVDHDCHLTMDDTTVAAGEVLTIDASALEAGDTLNFDGSPETDGTFTIIGSAGADIIVGGQGDDILDGGDGADTLNYERARSAVTVDLGIVGVQNVGGGQGSDTLTSFENIKGSNHADMLSGNSAANVLSGGSGTDTLTGGLGVDTFKFAEISDSAPDSMDLITDLDSSDVIDLHLIDANVGASGNQAFVFVAAFDGHLGQLTLTYDGVADRTLLAADIDGDMIADFAVLLDGEVTSTAGWLL